MDAAFLFIRLRLLGDAEEFLPARGADRDDQASSLSKLPEQGGRRSWRSCRNDDTVIRGIGRQTASPITDEDLHIAVAKTVEEATGVFSKRWKIFEAIHLCREPAKYGCLVARSCPYF
jgi:hypothetical protein